MYIIFDVEENKKIADCITSNCSQDIPETTLLVCYIYSNQLIIDYI